MKIRPCILLIEDNNLLLLKYNYNNHEVFALPGGNLEFGETLADCLIRELKEELNLDIAIENFVGVGELIDTEKHVIHFVFAGKIIAGQPNLNPDETTALSFEWIPTQSIEALNLYPNVKKLINTYNNGELNEPLIEKIEQLWF